jgi:hypothetical protein
MTDTIPNKALPSKTFEEMKGFLSTNFKGAKMNAPKACSEPFYDYHYTPAGTRDRFELKIINSVPPQNSPAFAIHQKLQAFFQQPHQTPFIQALRHLFLRSDGDKYSLVLQFSHNSISVSRAKKRFLAYLEQQIPEIRSIYALELHPDRGVLLANGPQQSRIDSKRWLGSGPLLMRPYTIQTKNTPKTVVLPLHPGDRCFPLALEQMCYETQLQLINPRPKDRLIHLYCSSAHSSLLLASQFEQTMFVDIRKLPQETIQSAIKKNGLKAQFTEAEVSTRWLDQFLPTLPKAMWTILLTPPQHIALTSAYIKKIEEFAPGRVLRVFADAPSMEIELRKWKQNNFIIRKSIPLKYAGNEMPLFFVLLVPDRDSILKQKKEPLVSGKNLSKRATQAATKDTAQSKTNTKQIRFVQPKNKRRK